MTTAADAQKVADLIKKNNIQIIDLKFTDLPGLWQHFSIPPREVLDFADLKNSIWVDGIGFDGSSIRGFQKIQESDMILIPDPDTAIIDPACEAPTLSMICDIQDPLTHEPYSRDPRYIAQKAEEYLKSTGIADTVLLGPGARVLRLRRRPLRSERARGLLPHRLRRGSVEHRREEESGNLGYKPRYKEGYFPVPPHDTLQDIRSEMVLEMEKAGITDRGPSPRSRHRRPERDRHALRHAGEDGRQRRCSTSTSSRTSPRRHGKVATFMPKPLFRTTAPACTPTSRSGRTANPLLRRQGLRAAPARCAAGTSAAFSSTAARSWPSAPRRPTPTSAWSPATKRRSTSSTPRATARPPPASPCTPPSPRQAHRVPPARPDRQPLPGLLARCSWPASTASRTRSTRASRWTRTPTSSRPRSSARIKTVPGSLEDALRALEAGPRLPAEGRCLHPGRHRHLARVQARSRDRPRPPAPAPVRVPPLLRRLAVETKSTAGRGGFQTRPYAARLQMTLRYG